MSEQAMEKILERLEALEEQLANADSQEVDGEPRGEIAEMADPPDEGDPDEKRRVDLIVRLVTENFDHLLRQRLADLTPEPIDEARFADKIADMVRMRIATMLYDLHQDEASHKGMHGQGQPGHGHRGHPEGGRDPGPRDRGPQDRGPDGRGPRNGGQWEGGSDRDRGRDGWGGPPDQRR